MSRTKILTYPHVSLRKRPSFHWSIAGDIDLHVQIALRMLSEMPSAAAIAANQLGFDERWFVLKKEIADQAGLGTQVIFNPNCGERQNDVMRVDYEGCLSLPNIKVPVPRPEKVLMLFDSELPKSDDSIVGCASCELVGFPARIICHEIDHLNGKLIIDYLPRKKMFEIRSTMLKRK